LHKGSCVNKLTNEKGTVCASINIFPEDRESWAIAVSWKEGVDGLPDSQAWNEAIESSLAQCKEKGATTVGSRVITANEGVGEALIAARAAMHRDSPIVRGFKRGEERVEYRMALNEALAALENRKITARLAWSCVDAGSESELARAAGLPRSRIRHRGYGSCLSLPQGDGRNNLPGRHGIAQRIGPLPLRAPWPAAIPRHG
jgi:hypothetical protein